MTQPASGTRRESGGNAGSRLPRLEWPILDYARDRPTFDLLRLWTQIVGKVRTAQTPWLNHSWHVPLYVTARGLGTSLIPHDDQAFELEFDFVDQRLRLRTSRGHDASIALQAAPVSAFLKSVTELMKSGEVPVAIYGRPNEVEDATPFASDDRPRSYDPDAAVRLWRTLSSTDRILRLFRTGFLGKASPVHFFWGSFDLAVSRFSGRPAPRHPGHVPHLPDSVAHEAYSHEVSSAGFWPGGGGLEEAAFYSYAYPEPPEFRDVVVSPVTAYFHHGLGEFLLPYEAVRAHPEPERTLLDFLESTYAAAADLGHWDRAALECRLGEPRVPRILAAPEREPATDK